MNVLTAIDQAARRAAEERDSHDANNAKEYADSWEALRAELREARAAVAELIEAARDVERRAGPDREPRLRAALAAFRGEA